MISYGNINGRSADYSHFCQNFDIKAKIDQLLIMNIYRNLKLSYKILIPVIILIGVIFILFTVYQLNSQRELDRVKLKEKADRLASLLSLSTAESVWNYDHENIKVIANAFFSDQDIVKIQILDSEDENLSLLTRDLHNGSESVERTITIVKNNNIVGEVKIILTNYHNEAVLRDVRTKQILLMIFIFAVLTILISFISKFTLKPLSNILNGISQLSAGNYQHKVMLTSTDELGKVADQFNNMSSKIVALQQEAVLAAVVGIEMQIATDIQMALQPQPAALVQDNYEIAALMMPAEKIGGDYYDCLRDIDGRLWFGIGDVTGHGILSGLIMMMTQVAVNTLLKNIVSISPVNLLIYINKILHSNIKHGLKTNHHITISFLSEITDGEFEFAGAHEIILIYRSKTGEIEQVETKGMWLGIIPDISKQTSKGSGKFSMEKNDVCLLYTDGVIEIMNKEKEQYDMHRLSSFIKRLAPEKSMQELTDLLYQELMVFKSEQLDDITYLFFKKK